VADIALNTKIHDEIAALADRLKSDDKLLTDRQLQRYLETFKDKFGPEQIARLDGQDLLEAIFNQGNRESLVYWLEFKNDEEFPTPRFGSIAGGSALKFSIFFRRETGSWMGRSSGNQPVEISEADALTVARRHRDQLLAGVDLLKALPPTPTDGDYEQLQAAMDSQAADVGDLAWAHKYFSIIFADKLDDYHLADLQRFHLIKLLQAPPDKRGRYFLGGWFVQLAAQVGLHLNQFTAVLNARHGRLHNYWRVGTSEGDNDPIYWPAMRDGNYVAVGWPNLGDLSALVGAQDARNELKRMLEQHHPSSPQAMGRGAAEILRFLREMDEGDIVVAANGATILGVGKVAPNSHYKFQPDDNFPHRRAVTWLDVQSWSLPQSREGLQSTFRELHIPENLVAIERRIIGAHPRPVAIPLPRPAEGAVPQLSGRSGRLQAILERKGQVILYGPPGTGKTFWAERTAKDLASYRAYGRPFADLDDGQRANFDREAYVRMCTFHPAYGYEDFLEGYRPHNPNGQLAYTLSDGIFKRLCHDAARNAASNYYLIIDEINRGDIPRIFGELLTVIEKPKRGRSVHLAVSGANFAVPTNVYLIGTMNTADRSIALLDKALRRRFGFVECMPEPEILNASILRGIPLGPWLDAVNRRIRQKVGRDARNLQIGHSYLMEGDRPLAEFARFVQVLQDEIIPLLEEYCYEDYSSLAEILGTGLVDVMNQSIRSELFEDARRDDLVQALLEPYPEITTSRPAVASESLSVDDEEEDAPAATEGVR